MTNRYIVGGIAFTADELLEGLDTDGFADAELRVRFVDDGAMHFADRRDARRLAGPVATSGAIAPTTCECWLPALAKDPNQRGWQLRQMAPIFGAALGRLVLHASATEIRGAVVGFIGESGAGKSTLARSLADGGHALAGDDLLPVRFTPTAASPVGHHLSPLRSLFLLNRTGTRDVRSERREPLQALRALIENGFGEHGDPDAWAFQFDAYHRLAEAVPVFTLTIPDDIDALPGVRDALVELVGGDRRESSTGGTA